jgi:hypothetical protein
MTEKRNSGIRTGKLKIVKKENNELNMGFSGSY